MKIIIYTLTFAAVITAAEEPKAPTTPPPATLNSVEAFSIRTIVAEARNLEEQLRLKRDQYEQFVSDACMRLFQVKACTIADNGTIVRRPAAPPATAAKKDEPKK